MTDWSVINLFLWQNDNPAAEVVLGMSFTRTQARRSLWPN